MDIQPVQSMRVIKYIGKEKEAQWLQHFLIEGFSGKLTPLESAGLLIHAILGADIRLFS